MSRPSLPKPAKLVVGAFMADRRLFSELAMDLEALWGPIDIVSPWLPFDFTDYYRTEMGAPLYRRMVCFQKLVPQENLVAVKLATNRLEETYRVPAGRRLNIDPGYLLLERFVLATGKNFCHRIHLAEGIYADLTLIFQRGGYSALPWTYPDYADQRMLAFLGRVRAKYAADLKAAAAST
jgi:hypothetical protein